MKVNKVYHLIIYCLNCIRRDQNSTYKTGLKQGQFINSELVQTLSNTISNMAEVMSNLQDSIAKIKIAEIL